MTPLQQQIVDEIRAGNLRYKQIAQKYDVTDAQVYRLKAKHIFTANPNYYQRDTFFNPDLVERDVSEIEFAETLPGFLPFVISIVARYSWGHYATSNRDDITQICHFTIWYGLKRNMEPKLITRAMRHSVISYLRNALWREQRVANTRQMRQDDYINEQTLIDNMTPEKLILTAEQISRFRRYRDHHRRRRKLWIDKLTVNNCLAGKVGKIVDRLEAGKSNREITRELEVSGGYVSMMSTALDYAVKHRLLVPLPKLSRKLFISKDKTDTIARETKADVRKRRACLVQMSIDSPPEDRKVLVELSRAVPLKDTEIQKRLGVPYRRFHRIKSRLKTLMTDTA